MSEPLFGPSGERTAPTEREMLDLLLARYNTERRGGAIADRWVRAEHVQSTQSYYQILSIADFIAIDKYQSQQAMHGHEVKVSRADWLTELRDPAKSERIKRFCDYWWLVVSDADIVQPGELPEDSRIGSSHWKKVRKRALHLGF